VQCTVAELPLDRFNHAWMWVVLRDVSSSSPLLLWGAFPLLPYLVKALADPSASLFVRPSSSSLPSSALLQRVVVIQRDECKPSPPPSSPVPPFVFPLQSSFRVSPSARINYSTLLRICQRRIDSFEDEEEKKKEEYNRDHDVASFTTLSTVVARHPPLGTRRATLSGLWLAAEHRLFMHRLCTGPLPTTVDFDAPFDGAGVHRLLPFAHLGVVRLSEGRVQCLSNGLVAAVVIGLVLREQLLRVLGDDEGHALRMSTHVLQKTIVPRLYWPLVQTLENRRNTTRTSRVHASSSSSSSSSSLLDRLPSSSLPDIESLEQILPACMRELAKRAFTPGLEHLHHEERRTFDHFVLKTGVPLESYVRALRARHPDDAKRQQKVENEARRAAKLIASDETKLFSSCKTMQAAGHCPYYTAAKGRCGPPSPPCKSCGACKARPACRANQVLLMHPHKDNGEWFSSPVDFALRVQCVRKGVVAPAAAAASSSSGGAAVARPRVPWRPIQYPSAAAAAAGPPPAPRRSPPAQPKRKHEFL